MYNFMKLVLVSSYKMQILKIHLFFLNNHKYTYLTVMYTTTEDMKFAMHLAPSRVRDPCFVRAFIRPLNNCLVQYEALGISEIELHI